MQIISLYLKIPRESMRRYKQAVEERAPDGESDVWQGSLSQPMEKDHFPYTHFLI